MDCPAFMFFMMCQESCGQTTNWFKQSEELISYWSEFHLRLTNATRGYPATPYIDMSTYSPKL
jgi:hypothetical protein